MIRHGLKTFLEEAEITVVDEAKNGIEALEKLENIGIDVLVTDIMMPDMDGIELTKQVSKKHPAINTIALTMMNEGYNIKKMLSAGAIGYLLKDCTQQELIDAIKTVASGKKYYTSAVTEIIMDGFGGKPEEKKRVVYEIPLSERELEVLHLICKEKTNPEIAEELLVSIRTIEAHKRNLIEKTGCKNVAGLVLYAIERNLFDDL
jgi:DNA-binding NarL/FixJ family response regulator